MKKLIIAACLLSTPAVAAQPLSPERAADKAVSILQGEPYGNTKSEVLSGISGQMLIVKGVDPCSKTRVKSPIWAFHVLATDPNSTDASGKPSKIDGFLSLNASSGKMVCAGLPFLD
ncbi:hypothetical protein M8994_18355 [Brucella sp. 21LCYQ03]|nr:hypothetical protein [Brucella sp. 21LCYQ03]